jgi:hypothetical protein
MKRCLRTNRRQPLVDKPNRHRSDPPRNEHGVLQGGIGGRAGAIPKSPRHAHHYLDRLPLPDKRRKVVEFPTIAPTPQHRDRRSQGSGHIRGSDAYTNGPDVDPDPHTRDDHDASGRKFGRKVVQTPAFVMIVGSGSIVGSGGIVGK